MSQPWDIIAVQDPPSRFPWMGLDDYYPSYKSERELQEEDEPDSYDNDSKNRLPLAYVCFYVHRSIPVSDWGVTYHENHNKGLVATLSLKTEGDTINIHNVYNHKCKIDIEELVETCMVTGKDLLLGDFNLHDEAWEPKNSSGANNTSSLGARLNASIRGAEMILVTEPGETTWRKSAHPNAKRSTIDLAFVSSSIHSRVLSNAKVDVHGFDSDHCVIQTTLKAPRFEEITVRRLWDETNEEEYKKAAKRVLRPLGFPLLDTEEHIDNYINKLADALQSVVDEWVPVARGVRKRSRGEEWLTPEARLLMELVQGAYDDYLKDPTIAHLNEWEKWKYELQGHIRRTQRRLYRQHVVYEARTTKGAFDLTRKAERMCKPRPVPHMPDLKHGDKLYRTGEEKAKCLLDTIWPNSEKVARKPRLPQIRRSQSARQYEVNRNIEPGEVTRLLKELKKGKAAGPDRLANETFLLAKGIINPYLEHLFNACLNISYHPIRFKKAITVVIQKPGKDTYSSPKSWRPIALLSCLGKMLEKVVANRLQYLAIRYGLLPQCQFAVAGRSPVTALQFFLNLIYKAWCKKKRHKATLLSLDISGAFDHVDREKLLEVLAEKGVPSWIILFVHSFLSDRSTVLKLPGHTSRYFRVNTGIPQGSTISPILFLFFAAPSLEKFPHCDYAPKTEVYAFAYMDDTYLMVISPSYPENCEALKYLHKELIDWADESSVDFNPQKYALMHFEPPRSRIQDLSAIPDIPALLKIGKTLVKKKLRILGVMVDHQLKFDDHIGEVRRPIAQASPANQGLQVCGRALRTIKRLKHISGPTWGPDLHRMRHLYVTKVRPIIAYASPAWFVPRADIMRCNPSECLRGGITAASIKRLEQVQYCCLVEIAGAFKGTSGEVLMKELHIPRLRVFLNAAGVAHRVRTLESEETQLMASIRNRNRVNTELRRHIYHLLHERAVDQHRAARESLVLRRGAEKAEEIWPTQMTSENVDKKVMKRINRAIKVYTQEMAEQESAELWNKYRQRRSAKGKAPTLALLEDWGPESFNYYKGMPRAHSTMLLQCRTESIGLNAHLHACQVNGYKVREPASDIDFSTD